jgi:hypothetical protein
LATKRVSRLDERNALPVERSGGAVAHRETPASAASACLARELHAERGSRPLTVQSGEIDRARLGVDFRERPRRETGDHGADFRRHFRDAAFEADVQALDRSAELDPRVDGIVFVAQREPERRGDRTGLNESRVAQLEALE